MNGTTYNVALVLHLLGAITFVAGIVVAGVGFEAARRREEAAEIALLLSITRIGVVLVALGTLLIAVFGLWLVHLGSWGYGSGWVDTSIGLYLAALALGGLGGQRPKQARPSRLREHVVGSDRERRVHRTDILHTRIGVKTPAPMRDASAGLYGLKTMIATIARTRTNEP